MNDKLRLPPLLLAFSLALSLAACKPETNAESSAPAAQSPPAFINTLGEGKPVMSYFPKYTDKVLEAYKQNGDTVGWLEVPGTKINDVVVCYTAPDDNNNYYYRRNFNKEYSFNGIYYADFRSKFGDYSAAQLPGNTVIYGHTMSGDKNGILFAPLMHFLEEEYAKATPYLYFSTSKEDMVFEVFAVFYATTKLPYNRPDLTAEQFASVLGECTKRSIYNYNTKVTAADKILTLSTCTYYVPGVGSVSYPNDYRYVIMAKRVEKRDATKTIAEFAKNPNPLAP